MKVFVTKNLPVILAAVATAPVTASVPAIGHGDEHAQFAHDAGKLDGLNSTKFMRSNDAWAYVTSSGGLYASSGNVTVTHPTTGEYCVVVRKRGSYKAAQVTLADPGGTKIVSVGTGHGSNCNPLFTDTREQFRSS